MLLNGFTASKPNAEFVNVGGIVNSDLNIRTMRKNQRYVYQNFGDKRYVIINEPPGAGKSTTMQFVFAERLIKDLTHKLIIAVPLTSISKSFGRYMLQYDNGSTIEWDYTLNLCGKWNGSKTNELVGFLLKDEFSRGIDKRIIMTTHITLANAFGAVESMLHENDVFRNTSIIIDEAHHILYPEKESNYVNMVGKLVRHVLTADDPTTNLWLPTATFYRGDQASIIPQESNDKFTRYFLPLDKHWEENIEHIKSFSFDFIVYKNSDPFEEIRTLIRNRKKTIIFCPYIGHLLNGGGELEKEEFAEKLSEIIGQEWPGASIINLVKKDREQEKDILMDDRLACNIDVILTVRIFDEGTDWKFAEQAIDLTPSNSLRVQSQRNGRLWRDYIGKEHIAYYVFLPFVKKTENEEEYRKHLSNSFNAFTAAILLHEEIQPIKLPKEAVPRVKDLNGNQYNNFFEMHVPDINNRQNILNEVKEEMVIVGKEHGVNPPTSVVKEHIEKIVLSHGITENVDKVVDHIGRLLCRPLAPKYGLDISWLREDGFDKIWRNEYFQEMLVWGTNVAGISTYKEFREAFGKWRSIDEWVKVAEKMVEDSEDGMIPSSSELIKTGYSVLDHWIRTKPDKFEHLKQKKKLLTPDEWVKVAEKMVENSEDGMLPPVHILRKNGLNGLALAKWRYPDKFEHLKQHKAVVLTPDEWVKVAEEMVEDSEDGMLPSDVELRRKGLHGLNNAMRKYPDKFEHLKQRQRRSDNIDDRYVLEAEEIALNNGGILPNTYWLQSHGHGQVAYWRLKQPEKFSHIRRMERKKIIEPTNIKTNLGD